MAAAAYLVDTSALARTSKAPVAAKLEPLVAEGLLATCSITDLELLFSARSGEDHRARGVDLDLRFGHVPIDQRVFDRALEVQGLLADRGWHRGVNVPNLIVAAAAEHAALTVLHYDAAFDLIASVTKQAVEWVLPRGSVD